MLEYRKMINISNLLPRLLSSKTLIVKEILFEDIVHFHLTMFGRGVKIVKASSTG